MDETVWELIRLAMMSVANMAIVPVQDILVLGGEARINDPRQTFGNWKWRLTREQSEKLPVGRLAEFSRIYGPSARCSAG